MKVYVVTAGCYSDYHIEAVFTDEQTARAYANMESDREVEEYEADSVKISMPGQRIRVFYNPRTNEIESLYTDNLKDRVHPPKDKYSYHLFEAWRVLSDRTLKDVQEYGKKSPLLLKAMQDSWAAYKAEHELDPLIADHPEEERKTVVVGPDEGVELFKKIMYYHNAFFASTSSATIVEGADSQ